MNNDATVMQQLQILREQTRLTGGLHEAQVANLKMWPLVVFDKSKSAEFTWDPDTKVFSYTIFPGQGRVNQRVLPERAKLLTEWVQFLLGSEWTVYIKYGKNEYRFDGTPHGTDTGTKGSPSDGEGT